MNTRVSGTAPESHGHKLTCLWAVDTFQYPYPVSLERSNCTSYLGTCVILVSPVVPNSLWPDATVVLDLGFSKFDRTKDNSYHLKIKLTFQSVRLRYRPRSIVWVETYLPDSPSILESQNIDHNPNQYSFSLFLKKYFVQKFIRARRHVTQPNWKKRQLIFIGSKKLKIPDSICRWRICSV